LSKELLFLRYQLIHFNMTVQNISQEELLLELQKGTSRSYKELYLTTFRQVEHFIKNNNGQQEDAKDVFQDAIIGLIKMISKPGFELNAKLSTLLFSICRNIWLKKLRSKKQGKTVNIIDDDEYAFVAIADDEIEEKKAIEGKHQLIADKLDEMSEVCQQVIRYFYYQRLPHQQIAEMMGYTIAYVRVRLHRCIEKLRKTTSNK